MCVCVRACECNYVAHVFADPMNVYDCIRLIFMYSAVILGNKLKFLFAAADCQCLCLHF